MKRGITVGGKLLSEHLEAVNHAKALDWINMQIDRKVNSFSMKDIFYMHEIILRGIDDDNAGRFRGVPVRIAGSKTVLPNYLKVPTLMEQFVIWLQTKNNLHPVEFAAEAHYQLVTIHPFIDSNGRTARLLMNMLLLANGYPFAIISEQERLAYIDALEEANCDGNKKNFYEIIMRAVDKSLDIYLEAVI